MPQIDKPQPRKIFPFTALVVTIVFIAGMSPYVRAVCNEKITSSGPYVYMPCPDDDPRWAQAFSHWSKRKNTKEAMAALAIYEAIAADKPDNTDVGAWLGWAYYFAAMRHRGKRDHYAEKGIAATEKVLAADPANIYALNWNSTSKVLTRPVSEEQYAAMHAYYSKFYHFRELPVPGDDPLWAEAMKLWDARLTAQDVEKVEARIKGGVELTDEHMKHIQKKAKAIITVFEKLESKYPDRIEPKLWLLRSNYWMTQVCVDPKVRAKWGKLGMERGLKAIEMEPRNAAANSFTALCTGEYSEDKSFAISLKSSMQAGRQILVLVEEDPNHYYCVFSRYFCMAIAATGNIAYRVAEVLGYPKEVIDRLTDFSSNLHPDFLQNHFELAKLHFSLGRKEKARKLLETIIKADPTLLEYQEPENRLTQFNTKRELDKLFK